MLESPQGLAFRFNIRKTWQHALTRVRKQELRATLTQGLMELDCSRRRQARALLARTGVSALVSRASRHPPLSGDDLVCVEAAETAGYAAHSRSFRTPNSPASLSRCPSNAVGSGMPSRTRSTRH